MPSAIVLAFTSVVDLPRVAAKEAAGLAASSTSNDVCASHETLTECTLFRNQHACVWDVPSSTCVPDEPCEQRDLQRCEFEITTGRGASWDHTSNRCFFDHWLGACRWSDECLTQATAASCHQRHCVWDLRCAPMDQVFAPGPGQCTHLCVPLSLASLSAPDVANVTFQRLATPQGTEHKKPDQHGKELITISLPAGMLQGIRTQVVDQYLGVPFAAAPVGDLRWSPPRKLPAWRGVRNASSFGPSCAQGVDYHLHSSTCKGYTRGGCAGYSEDCLNLNVYAPRSAGPKAVMVWIHGGCFVSGSSSEYDGATLAAEQNVLVVTVNYRLGIFGFLGHDALRPRDPSGSTGNYGLLDNVAALEWIQENIVSFGGDPSRVTIFGESSGAGSVSQLLGVQRAWPYFHQGIMESGAASFWTYMDMMAAYHNFEQAVSAVACGHSQSIADRITCLLQAPVDRLSSAVTSVYCRDSCSWTPVVDGVVVRGRTWELAKAGLLRPDTPTMSGYNLNDGALFVPGSYLMSESGLATYFATRFGPNRVAQLEELYPTPGSSPVWFFSRSFMAAQSCETDWSYACSAEFLATAAPGASYVYEFSQPSAMGSVLHGDEIAYVFGTVSGAVDQQVSQMVMAYWANFARSGDPNGEGLPKWPQWSASKTLLNISVSSSLAHGPRAMECAFFAEHWDYYKVCLPQNPSITAGSSGATEGKGAASVLII